jgi:hypothetical protein
MENDFLAEKVAKLPADIKLQVNDFVDFLLEKSRKASDTLNKPVFGSGKGMIKILPGFDEPLEDFKDYM